MERLAFTVFLASVTLCALLGFGTSMTFLWPGYLLVGLSALLTVPLLFRKKDSSASRTVPSTICLAAGTTLAGYLVLRGSLSPVAYLAREDMALVAIWFCVWALVAVVFSRSGFRMALVWMLGGLVVVNLAMAFWQAAFDPGFWFLPGYSRTYLDRAGGVFNNPNHLAAFLAALAPFFAAVAIWGRTGPHRRILLAFLGALCLLGLALTQSRGGFLAAGAGLGTLVCLAAWLHRSAWRERRGLALSMAALVLVAVGALAAVNFEGLQKRFGDGGFSRAAEANRPLLWEAAFEQNAEAPLAGTGSRTFFYFSRRFRSPEMHVSVLEADFAHNDYVQMLADYGWIGLGLLGLVIVFHGASGLRLFRRYSREYEACTRLSLQSRHLALTVGAMAGLAALGVHALVDFHLHVPAVAVIAALFLGILGNPGHPPRKRHARWRFPVASLSRIAVPLAGAALLIAGTSFVRSEWHFERARKLFAGENDLRLFGHLRRARVLDPANPFAHSLSGHAHLYAIDGSMPQPVRESYLEKARSHFEAGLDRFPQDIYAMLGLASCLDALERHDEAEAALDRARTWAPLYGNIMHAQGAHFLLVGDLDRAESHFREARDAGAFRDWRAAARALERIAAIRDQMPPTEPGSIAER